MKESFPATTVLCAALILAFSGCSKKTDAKSELEKTASLLEKTEAAPAPATQPLQPAAAPTAEPPPARQMNQALAAYKSGDLQDAVTRLQTLRAMPTMSPEQRMAVNDAMAAVMGEIYALAAKGDARAIQAVKLYEQMQTQSH